MIKECYRNGITDQVMPCIVTFPDLERIGNSGRASLKPMQRNTATNAGQVL